MPKDPIKNIGNYKIEGGQFNEYEFQQNQAEFAEQHEEATDDWAPSKLPGEPTPQVSESASETSGPAETSEPSSPKMVAAVAPKPAATKKRPIAKKAAGKSARKGTKKAAAKKRPAKKLAARPAKKATKKVAPKAARKTTKKASKKLTKKAAGKRPTGKKRPAAKKRAAGKSQKARKK